MRCTRGAGGGQAEEEDEGEEELGSGGKGMISTGAYSVGLLMPAEGNRAERKRQIIFVNVSLIFLHLSGMEACAACESARGWYLWPLSMVDGQCRRLDYKSYACLRPEKR